MINLIVNTMDIIAGKRGNAQECAVACAMKRLVQNRYHVGVFNSAIVLKERMTLKEIGRYPLTAELKSFIDAFDNGLVPVTALPTEYKLRGSLPA